MMAKREGSSLIRCPKEAREFINDLSRFKTFQEKQKIPAERIVKAMFNQYKKYPFLTEEIKNSKLGKL